ncbi:hypothetical protein [Haloechinothrix halophila]|uniref:hypothetical protein n=1 Tax=Haloechinothrix halophila TaxID=1069073 RepID=UPI00040BDAAE|nr:hypothetical protein [Haloechinothrix halophila]
MKLQGPLVTLFAVAVIAVTLFAVNESQAPDLAAEQAAPSTEAAAPPTTETAPPSTTAASAAPSTTTTQQVDSAFPDEAVYVGRSQTGGIAVAVAVSGTRAAGYLCDGESVEWWLEGTVSGDTVTLRGPDGTRLTGQLSNYSVSGEITAPGKQWRYSTQLANEPAGLYQGSATVDGQQNEIGWIVLPDGSQVGVRTVSGQPSPAPALSVAKGGARVDGAFVAAERIDGDSDVLGVR